MDLAERSAALGAVLDCSPRPAEALAQAMVPQDYTSKTYLTHQGDLGDHLWLILSGTVQLQALSLEGQATVISSCGPGELVGAYPDEDENFYDAMAFGDVAALRVGTGQLHGLMQDWPELGVGLSAIFANQLDTVLDRLSARVTLTATGRVYRELVRLAGDTGLIAPPPVVAALAISAQTTRETASRAISALERRGIISREDKCLTIVSPRLLEELIL